MKALPRSIPKHGNSFPEKMKDSFAALKTKVRYGLPLIAHVDNVISSKPYVLKIRYQE